MTGVIATIPQFQFSSSTGVPLALGTLTVYLAGTTTPTDTWQDQALSTLNTNPVQLDSSGSCVLWLDSTKSYKFILKNAAGAIQWTRDNIAGADAHLRGDLAAFSGSSLVNGTWFGGVVATVAQLATSIGASLLGFIQAGVSAVLRSIQSKLRETVSVLDFMTEAQRADVLARTFTLDVSAAVQAAVTYLGTVKGGTLIFPGGGYRIETAINLALDAITLKGVGVSQGASGASLEGATVIRCIGVNFINNSATVNNFSMEDMYVTATVTSGAALAIANGAGINNLYMKKVFVEGMANALYVNASGAFVHLKMDFCQFGYTTGNHIYIANGADVGSALISNTRFEPAGDGYAAIKAFGAAYATGSFKFINCVFESMNSLIAVDIGANATAWSFIGCHFENNGCPITGVATVGACDIKVGGGQSNVLISGCMFSFPYTTATGFYNIINESGGLVTCINNTINGMGHAGYVGFVSDTYGCNTTLISNKYNETGSPWIDYAQHTTNPVRVNDFQASLKAGAVNAGIVRSVTTTNATATRIWGELYQFQASEAIYATADVVGIDSTGAVFAAFTVRQLFTTDASNNGTARATANETAIVSGAQAAAFALVGGAASLGLELKVTGIAATTIKWVAKINLNKIGH